MRCAPGAKRLRGVGALVLSLALAAGCGGRYGTIRWDTGVGRIFERAHLLPRCGGQ